MGFKKERFGTKIVNAARSGERFNDVHVFFGGTGAVGGTALLHMLSIYEEMMAINPPKNEDVVVLVATGRTRQEVEGFTQRIFRFVESRYGKDFLPTRVRNGYLTHSGVFISLERFSVSALPGIDKIEETPLHERQALVDRFLASINSSRDDPNVFVSLKDAIKGIKPFTTFLKEYQERHLAQRGIQRYRSVIVGIPLPSLMAYHQRGLEEMAKYIPYLTKDQVEELKENAVIAIRDDIAAIQGNMADNCLVAHTTAVGGMYDIVKDEHGERRPIRLGFAHSALDYRLVDKQRFADRLTELYASAGVKMLITAAAIGIDEVKIKSEVPVHRDIGRLLFDADFEVFDGSKETLPLEAKASKEAGRPVPVQQVIRIFRPLTVPFDNPPQEKITFERGEELRPSFVFRSGENGYFTVANAEALYRVMKVASASELGLVLASVGIFGDDPYSPWFENNICYYTETDNSRQVFDFMAQPMLRDAQLSGLDPMALQDLGSAKHQAELHTLGLLILLHRLRTLSIEAIPPYVDPEKFDGASFFVARSRPLTFEDVSEWDVQETARDLATLAGADTPEDLEVLLRRRQGVEFYPARKKARRKVLECVLKAAWMPPCIGSPIIFERGGNTFIRTGYFVAPLDCLVTNKASIEETIKKLHKESQNQCDYETYRAYHICNGGFIDLRPHAIVCTARNDKIPLNGHIHWARDENQLRNILKTLEPYSMFTMCGMVAILYRLKALNAILRESIIELGTLHEFRYAMPKDDSGRILVTPGVVEAMRMVAEGLEKTTGTERLDGIWGYERRTILDRRAILLGKR